jgi:hypothetical protein
LDQFDNIENFNIQKDIAAAEGIEGIEGIDIPNFFENVIEDIDNVEEEGMVRRTGAEENEASAYGYRYEKH